MLTHLGIPSTCPHVTPYALLPNIWTPSATPSLPQQQRRRRLVRTLPNTARRLHPVNRAPEGVPSSLFNFRRKVPRSPNEDGDGGEGAGDSAAATAAEALESGVVEDSDLEGVSALLVEVFPAGVILADGEFSELESVIIGAPLEITNKYLRAVAFYEVLYALKSRCGDRLRRGDFALTSEALVLAVRDPAASEGEGGSCRGMIAAVELTLRQPNGSLPSNWPFPAPWRRTKPGREWEPYMCNLGVAKGYRGNGYGKQLVRLCENIAKNHWGYQRMYLHVDMADPAATGLYSSMGYKGMEQFDAPAWMRRLLKMPTIRYQVKEFKGRRGAD